MTDNNKTEDNQTKEEKQVWNNIVDIVVGTAKSTKNLDFNKFKIRYTLELEEMSHKTQGAPEQRLSRESLDQKLRVLDKQKSSFQKEYEDHSSQLKELETKYSDKPRILIMLDPAKNQLKKCLAYAYNKPPTFSQIKNQVHSITTAPPKESVKDEPSQNIAN
ncbi:MAG: hypothetical protein P1U74_10565 [Legionellaceae bacterium]|nr:hypothetical protein [Legionellaceae bacterium]